MTRLFATVACDIRIQYRQGFYYAIAFLAGLLIVILRRLGPLQLDWAIPPLVLGNLVTGTFYFLAGLLFLEKAEGTLRAQGVTPLRPWEYLLAKVITLGLLGILEHSLILKWGYGISWRQTLWIALGVALAGALYVLAGFLVAIRYRSINEYLLPSMVYTALLVIPFLPYFGFWQGWAFYLHPVQAPLEILKAAFEAPSRPMLLYGVLYSSACFAGLLWLSVKGYTRFVSQTGRSQP